MKKDDIIKTTITFNPRIKKEADILSVLYEKGKFSTNIKAILEKAICVDKASYNCNIFADMDNEQLISNLGMLLYTLDKKGLDVSKMLLGYCNITVPISIPMQNTQDNNNNNIQVEVINQKEIINQEEIEQMEEDISSCGIDLC